jgi:CubicO group peptidase (beta-lactamase class C family)
MRNFFYRALAGAGVAATLAFAILAFAILAPAQAQSPNTIIAPPLDATHVEAFADGAVLSAMHKDHIAGVSVAIIRGHDILLAKGYGLAAPGKPADGDTLFRVGSISKTGTWIAIMQLVEQGKLKLDDPINAHLPPALQVPDEGFKDPIRVRNLMSHNAGFEDAVFGTLFQFDANRLQPQDVYLAQHRPHRMRPAGEIAVYSNYGAGLAGSIIAHVSGQDWPTYAEAHILRPLGMATATYRDPYSAAIASAHHLAAPMPADVAQRVTQGWKFADGRLEKVPYEYVSQIASAGSLSMSASDAAHYMIALLNPEVLEQAGVLKQGTFATMKEPLFQNHPALGAIRHGFLSYDLGGGRWAFGHDGGLASHFSRLEVSPDLGVGVFVSVNTQGTGVFPGNFVRTFFERFFPAAQEKSAVPRDAVAAAQKYAGGYRALRRAYFRTEAGFMSLLVTNITALPDGDLMAGALVGPAQRLHPIGGGVYRAVGETARLAFGERDGRMIAYDEFGVGPAERVGYFEGLNWFILITCLGIFTAVWGTASGIRRTVLGFETPAAFALDGLCLLWLVGLVLFVMALVPMLSDLTVVWTNYPNPVLVSGLWLLLIAAIATPLVPIAAFFLARPRWSWFHWARVSLALLVFLALGLTLWQHGLLGFSDWS